MAQQMSKQELIDLVRRIMEVDGSEAEINRAIVTFKEQVPHPEATDLIFYPEKEMTPEEIVEVALSYKPVPLSGSGQEFKNRED